MGRRIGIDKSKSIVFLAAGLVMTVTWAVGSSGWTRGLNIVTFVGLGAILIGMMLARSILPGLLAHGFSLIIGIAWSFWVTSRLLPVSYSWLERWENLAIRLNQWYTLAMQGGTSYDNLMFILQMSVIVWGTGYLTIWFIFRSARVWQAIVPGGLVLTINLYYAPKDITFWFLVYLLLSLLLVIRFHVFSQEVKWRAEGVFFRPDISFDFLRDGFVFSLLVIGLAWLAPPLVDAKSIGVFSEFQGTWSDIQGEWNRMFADLNYRDTGVVGTFGQTLALGGPRQLTDEPVMDVKVEGIGRYWRASVYDDYTGVGWRNTDGESATFGPTAELALPVFAARIPVTQTYTLYRDSATTLYGMGQIVALNRSARVTFNELPADQTGTSGGPSWPSPANSLVEEITYIRSNAAVNRGESYQIVSAATQATIAQLRSAGSDYPAWVTERYLGLPDSTTERTRQLARELTQEYDNPFDQARAIERYLRAEIRYNEKIPAPPINVDKVDYILFELKEAYCDYYASSMIVMLRSVGIPARLAAGYARGRYEAEQDVFHVVNADAHSWVEVYFPQYGWIEFEPTAAQPSIIRPVGSENEAGFASGIGSNLENNPNERPELDTPEGNIPIDDEAFGTGGLPLIFSVPWFGTQVEIPRAAVNGSFMVVGLLVNAGAAAIGLWWWRQQLQITKNIFNLYQGMVKLANWMGVAVQPWQTPYEHAVILKQHMPSYEQDVEIITDEYVYRTFSLTGKSGMTGGTQFETTITHESDLAWRRLRPEMIKLAIKNRLPSWLGGY